MKTEKLCPKCKIVKPASEFYIIGKYLSAYCKACTSIFSKEYHKNNKNEIHKRKYNHRINNIDKYIKSERAIHKDPKHIHRQWATYSIRHHKKRGFKMSMTIEELTKRAKTITYCPMCGIKLKWYYGNLSSNSPTVDRIDSNNELTMDNTQIICHKCNMAKRDRTMKEFVEYCRTIVEKFG